MAKVGVEKVGTLPHRRAVQHHESTPDRTGRQVQGGRQPYVTGVNGQFHAGQDSGGA